MIADCLRVAYGPAAYYRPWRRAHAAASPLQKRWLNAQLIERLQLPVADPPSVPLNMMATRLVRQWHHLPQAAVLLAAARLRLPLLAHRSSLALPSAVLAFAYAHAREGGGEAHAAFPQAQGLALVDLLAGWGGARLQVLADHLPAWLGARLSLPFAGLETGPAGQCSDPADIDLFWSALQHAEKVS